MVTDESRDEPITANLLLSDLLRAHPETRAVLDRFGLRGCGGSDGPHEPIRTFARAHGIDEARLLDELQSAVAFSSDGGAAGAPVLPGIADTIYRRYFLGGIVLALTAGATWGAWLLWTIALTGSFRSISLSNINAHGEAQIFGWVGLFIMGFAYQAFPRFWQTTLVTPRLAAHAFALMVAGLIVRTVAIATGEVWSLAAPTALLGGLLQVAAAMIFTGQILATLGRSRVRIDPGVGFILSALAWFVLSICGSVWHTWNTMTARTPEELIWYVATYQAPLRDLQIHGLALFMILGVSLRMLPALFDRPGVPDRRAWWALALLVAGVVIETVLFLVYRWTGQRGFAAGLPLAHAMLVAGVALVVLPWKLWEPFPGCDRSGKFVRAAYTWLAISLAMLLVSPAHRLISGLPFSHAYHGAIRHAITVGFISLMITGMAAKVVPTLNGVDPRTLSRLWGPFLLLNFGCLLRVVLQTLSDWTGSVYPLLGVSGTLEVVGLAWWGAELIRLILAGMRESEIEHHPNGPRPDRIEAEHRVADVLDWFPEVEPVLVQLGFTALRQPLLRRTIARQVTIAHAARVRMIGVEELLDTLNAAIVPRCAAQDQPQRVPLTSLTGAKS